MRKHCVTVIVAILLVLGGGSPASAQAPKDELPHPKTLDELQDVPELRRWQIEEMGDEFLKAL